MSSLKLLISSVALGVGALSCSQGSPAPSRGSAVLIAPAASKPRVRKDVRLLHIADTHAQLETHPEYMPGETPHITRLGGYARIRTAFDTERATARGAVFVADGGDAFQGSGPAAWSEGEVVLEPFNAQLAFRRQGRAVANDLPPQVFSQDELLRDAANQRSAR